MKAYAIVLASGALALAATSLIEVISMWGPLVLMTLLTALMTVWIIKSENDDARADVSFKKAA